MGRRINLALAILLHSAAIAQITNINETYTVGEDPQLVLGYPVPIPVNNPIAGDHFRTYDALRTRWSALYLANDFIEEHEIGATIYDRDIYAYTISDADQVAVDGTIEPGILVDGTIHAREWVSPEILTRLGEYFADNAATDPVIAYLIEQNSSVLIPVLNVDGFLQTQRYPDQYYNSGQRRDGRMRRKNMLNVDEVLTTTTDNLLGVDLNRNFPVGWSFGSSSTTQQFYRGPSSLSEPESQALANAVDLFEESQLRCYLDMHGTESTIYNIKTNNAGVDAVSAQLTSRMQSTLRFYNPILNAYDEIVLETSDQIGVSDEYFANTHLIPAHTIEYTPPNYRESGPQPDPFVTPEDEIGFITEENISAVLLAMLFASGPPILEEVIIWRDSDNDDIGSGETVRHAEWQPIAPLPATAREMVNHATSPLMQGETYDIILKFNKPMRRFDNGQPTNWPGVTITMQPDVSIELFDGATTTTIAAQPVGDGWLENNFRRFAADSWHGTITLPSIPVSAPQEIPLRVSTVDLYGHALDAQPATVTEWDAGWIGYEDASGVGSVGGTDESVVLTVEQPLRIHGWQLLEN